MKEQTTIRRLSLIGVSSSQGISPRMKTPIPKRLSTYIHQFQLHLCLLHEGI